MSSITQVYNEQYKKYLADNGYKSNRQMLTVFSTFYSAVVNSFKWTGLPKYIPHFFPERWLYRNGLLAGDVREGKVSLFPAFGNGDYGEYGLFSDYTLVAPNGETFTRKREDIALCWNNCMALPSLFIVDELAGKCSHALNAVNNTLKRAIFSRIIECKEPAELDKMMGILSSDEDTRIAILTLGNAIKEGTITVHNLFDNSTDDVLAIWDVYIRYRNMFYTTFGFDTVEIQKKERLTEAEGSANSEIARYTIFDDMFDCRQAFVKEMKEKFGMELGIEINRNSATVYSMQLDNDDKIENEIIEISKGSNIQSPEEENKAEEEVENE